jgi:hypothetical protein
MKRTRVSVAALALAVLLVPSLAASVGAQEGDRPVLRFGVNAADVQALDPHQATGTQDRTVVDMIFNGLIRFQPGNSAEMEPDLAEAIPEPAMDGEQQVWTFTCATTRCATPGPGQRGLPADGRRCRLLLEKSADSERSAYAGEYAGIEVAEASTSGRSRSPSTRRSRRPSSCRRSPTTPGGFVVCSPGA